VELLNFTNAVKVDIFSKLRMAFDAAKVRVPSDRTIREDLHSVHRVTMGGGGVTYRAPHTDDGHADRCTALALAMRAAATGAVGVLRDVSGIMIGTNRVTARHFTPRRLQAA
jgi:phage FluMu gp28-like protein